jgi:hypothetical protein
MGEGCVLRCVWVVVIVTCDIVNAIHLFKCHQCGTMLAREKQQVTFVVDMVLQYHMHDI